MMFKYRIYPSRKNKQRLINNFKICKSIYNELLELNKLYYDELSKGLTKFDCNKILTGEFTEIHSQIKQNVSDRFAKAMQNFFRRVKDKSCRKKGYPRFKSRVNSITYPQSGFKFVSDKRLYCSKIGNIPIVLHRVLRGKIKTLTIKVNKTNQWFAIFSCEIETTEIIHPSKEKIGIDVGLENFATLSNGEIVSNPRFLIESEKRLKRLQRRLSRKKKGSANRRKAIFRVAKQYIKVSNQRSDFLHKLSRSLVVKYSVIAVEDLNIKEMMRNRWLAKSISDASWGSFIQMLSYKAITSGGQLIKVEPRMTSKTCSECGTIVKMPLSKRKFKCSKCGFVCHRDLNASLNILGRAGLVRTSQTPVDIEPLLQNTEASSIVEAGTICDIG